MKKNHSCLRNVLSLFFCFLMVTSCSSLATSGSFSTSIEYIITFNGNGGTLLSGEEVQIVKYASDIEEPTYEKTGYTFSNWDFDFNEPITNDLTVNAIWVINKYTITWENYDGTVLEVDSDVIYGTTPTYDGDVPTKEDDNQGSHTFTGWTPLVSEVSGDMVYIAVFDNEINSCVVTWINYDGAILETDNVIYGSEFSYDGTTPTRSNDSQYIYTFCGWKVETSPVTLNQTYTAQFSAISRTKTIKNVILMIGDGMGENQIKVTEAYNEKKTALSDKALVSGYMTTTSETGTTDSAAAATAMSTGEKVANAALAYKNDTNLKTVSEIAKEHQKGVGIITSDVITGATSAAFSSHNINRYNTDQIAVEQIQSDIDLFIGAGKSYYDQQTTIMSQNNRSYYTDFSVLENDIVSAQNTNYNSFGRFLASFDSLSTSTSTAQCPSLADVTTLSLDYLSSRYDEEGFFAMVECGGIDVSSHSNNILGMIEQVNSFDKTVSEVVDWAVSRDDTFVMVVADHETGGLLYNGETKNDIVDTMFTTTGHTSTNVPFYLYIGEDISFINNNDIIDNTDVAKLLNKIIWPSI